MQNFSIFSNENDFDLHQNESVGGTHFHMNGFAQSLVLRRSEWGGGGGVHMSVKISLLCRLSVKSFDLCRLSVNLS